MGVGHAIAQNLNDVWVMEHTQGHHLSPKLLRAFESVWVETLDGHGDSVGELGLVDVAESATADDKVSGEVFGGPPQLGHGDLESGVEGSAIIDGNGGEQLGCSCSCRHGVLDFLGFLAFNFSTQHGQESKEHDDYDRGRSMR